MRLVDSAEEALKLLYQSNGAPLTAEVVDEVLIRLEMANKPYLVTFYPESDQRPEHWLIQLPEKSGQYRMSDNLAPSLEYALTKLLNQRRVLVDQDTAVVLAEGLSVMGLPYLCLFHPNSENAPIHFEFRKPEYFGEISF